MYWEADKIATTVAGKTGLHNWSQIAAPNKICSCVTQALQVSVKYFLHDDYETERNENLAEGESRRRELGMDALLNGFKIKYERNNV